ncbi:MAG TPA: helix-turn-helix domain-containing protein, partial [Vulgatibacter sp.]
NFFAADLRADVFSRDRVLPPAAPKQDRPTDSLWTSAQVAGYLQVSESWVRKASASGKLPCVRIGAMVRFDPDAVRAWARGERGGKVTNLQRR